MNLLFSCLCLLGIIILISASPTPKSSKGKKYQGSHKAAKARFDLKDRDKKKIHDTHQRNYQNYHIREKKLSSSKYHGKSYKNKELKKNDKRHKNKHVNQRGGNIFKNRRPTNALTPGGKLNTKRQGNKNRRSRFNQNQMLSLKSFGPKDKPQIRQSKKSNSHKKVHKDNRNERMWQNGKKKKIDKQYIKRKQKKGSKINGKKQSGKKGTTRSKKKSHKQQPQKTNHQPKNEKMQHLNTSEQNQDIKQHEKVQKIEKIRQSQQVQENDQIQKTEELRTTTISSRSSSPLKRMGRKKSGVKRIIKHNTTNRSTRKPRPSITIKTTTTLPITKPWELKTFKDDMNRIVHINKNGSVFVAGENFKNMKDYEEMVQREKKIIDEFEEKMRQKKAGTYVEPLETFCDRVINGICYTDEIISCKDDNCLEGVILPGYYDRKTGKDGTGKPYTFKHTTTTPMPKITEVPEEYKFLFKIGGEPLYKACLKPNLNTY